MKAKHPFLVLSFLASVLVLLVWNNTAVLAEGESTYVVQPGDVLWKLAQRFGTSIDELVNLNDIRNPDLIFVGQVLTIPAGTTPSPVQTAGGPLRLSWSLVDWRPGVRGCSGSCRVSRTRRLSACPRSISRPTSRPWPRRFAKPAARRCSCARRST